MIANSKKDFHCIFFFSESKQKGCCGRWKSGLPEMSTSSSLEPVDMLPYLAERTWQMGLVKI